MIRADPSSEQQALTLQQALDLGLQHHTAGRLSEAENIYQQILETDPNYPDALHLLGVIFQQKGENDRAVDLITKAIEIKPEYGEAHNNLGNVLQNWGSLMKPLKAIVRPSPSSPITPRRITTFTLCCLIPVI